MPGAGPPWRQVPARRGARYESFLQLMADFCVMSSWDAGADGLDGGALEEGPASADAELEARTE